MNKLWKMAPLLLALAFSSTACDFETPKKEQDETKEDDHHSHQGSHGGAVLDSGGTVHVEMVHDQTAGKVSLYILGGDAKTAEYLAEAPFLNLKTADGSRQIKTEAVDQGERGASHFEATDEALKGHLHGRVALTFEGKRYNLDIGHDHGDHGHGHGDHDHGHAHPEHAISHTAWTEQCEWFVELETPEVGKPVAFAAHVTLLDSFAPATEGTFTAKAKSGTNTAGANAEKPARPGIFTPEITFPSAGKWQLTLAFESGDLNDETTYEIEVHEPGQIPDDEEEEQDAISFLKEQQWKTAFATAWAAHREISGEQVLAVPASALMEEGSRAFVYVQLDGESFQRREVETGRREGDWVEITSGLEEHERVVTQGAAEIE